MKARNRTKTFLPLAAVALATFAFTATSANAGIVFQDDFESPDVTAAEGSGGGTGGTSNTADTSKWVRASAGYGANANGLLDEGSGEFTDPVGQQAYGFRYTNSGVTSAEGLIDALTAGSTYTVSFDVVLDGFNDGNPYTAKLVVFEDGAARTATQNNTGTTILKQVGGSTSSTSYTNVTFDFTADAVDHAGSLNKDVAIRFIGATDSAIIDNVSVDVASIPEPSTIALAALGLLGLLGWSRRSRR